MRRNNTSTRANNSSRSNGFVDVVVRAAAQTEDFRVLPALCGEYENQRRIASGAQTSHQVEAVSVRQ